MGPLLNVRLRAASYVLMLVPLLLLAPLRGHGFAVFASPLGAGLLALLLLAGGSMLDERGGVVALRAGAAVRASALAVFLAGFALAYAQGRHPSLARVPAWAWALMLASSAHMAYGAARDVGAAIDPRRGQRVRLEGFDTASIRLRTRAGEVTVPTDSVRGARVARFRDTRGVLLTLAGRDRIWGDAAALPWVGDPSGHTIRLTEHQLGADAEVFAREVLDHAERSGRYR